MFYLYLEACSHLIETVNIESPCLTAFYKYILHKLSFFKAVQTNSHAYCMSCVNEFHKPIMHCTYSKTSSLFQDFQSISLKSPDPSFERETSSSILSLRSAFLYALIESSLSYFFFKLRVSKIFEPFGHFDCFLLHFFHPHCIFFFQM